MFLPAQPIPAALRSRIAPLRSNNGLGALPANESSYVLPSGALSTPGQGGKVRSTYSGPGAWAGHVPTYPSLPKAPKGAQGAVEFPYTINAPSVTGNFFWYTGGGVVNVGFPRYSNDCWEYLRYAMVESDFDSVVKWLAWAILSFKWQQSDIQSFNFGQWRFIDARYAPPGATAFRTAYTVPRYGIPNGTAVPGVPILASAPAGSVTVAPVASVSVATGGQKGKLLGLGSLGATMVGIPYAQPLWWSLADLSAFVHALQKYADPKGISGKCIDSILGNWSQAWNNYKAAPGGPIIPSINLGSCPRQDSFWQGLAIYVASIAAIYGIAYVAATAAATGAGTAAVGTGAGATGAVDTAVLTDVTVSGSMIPTGAGILGAGTAGTTTAAAVAAETIPEVIVTAAPIGTGLTAGEVAAITAGAGAAVATTVAAEGASAAPSLPAASHPPPVAAGTAGAGATATHGAGTIASTIASGAGAVKGIVGAAGAVAAASGSHPSTTPVVVAPSTSPLGIPTAGWLGLAALALLAVMS